MSAKLTHPESAFGNFASRLRLFSLLARPSVDITRTKLGTPRWQRSGSQISSRSPGATASDIPWLKLSVTSARGNGALSGVTTVQRINTKGGAAEGAVRPKKLPKRSLLKRIRVSQARLKLKWLLASHRWWRGPVSHWAANRGVTDDKRSHSFFRRFHSVGQQAKAKL